MLIDPNLIAPLFPTDVISEQIVGNPVVDEIFPEELQYVADAVEKRRREFSYGRLCARRVLARCGIAGVPLLVGADRAPIWPTGIVGSITHTHGFCGVAVARQGHIQGLGLDAEPSEPLPADLWPLILVAGEIERLSRFPEAEQGLLARLIFSAKESVYKCRQALGSAWLEFHDIEILVDRDRSTFSVEWRKSDPLVTAAGRLEGRFRILPEWILTGSCWFRS